jgi:hypothetical protein
MFLERLTKLSLEEESRADDNTAKGEESLMNICPPFEADAQPAKLMKPTQGPLYYPPRYTQATAMRLAPLTQHRQDVSTPQVLTQCSRIIPSVSLKLQRSPARPTPLALHCRNGIHQFESLSHIVGVSAS